MVFFGRMSEISLDIRPSLVPLLCVSLSLVLFRSDPLCHPTPSSNTAPDSQYSLEGEKPFRAVPYMPPAIPRGATNSLIARLRPYSHSTSAHSIAEGCTLLDSPPQSGPRCDSGEYTTRHAPLCFTCNARLTLPLSCGRERSISFPFRDLAQFSSPPPHPQAYTARYRSDSAPPAGSFRHRRYSADALYSS